MYKTLTAILFCVLCQSPALSDTLNKESYVLGVVPQFEVRKLYAIWQPIIDEIAMKTGIQIELAPSKNIEEFEMEFAQQKFDFAYMNPYHMLVASEHGYEPLVRDTSKMLYGILVVRSDSDIRSPLDLNDKVIAFPSPNALGASLQMRQELHDQFGIQIRPNYVKTHDSVYLNVILYEAVAGGGVQKTLSRQPLNYQEQVRIVHKTTPVSPHPVAIRASLPAPLKASIKRAFIAMGEKQEGQKKLEKIPIKRIGPAGMEDYLPLKKMGLDRFYVKPGA
jgi:phosphonate transport system substrate-binding protein